MNESLAYGCTETEMDGIRIRGPTRWKRYSTRQGGDAITFLREFCGMRFSETVYPFVFLDAIHYKVKADHQYQTKAAYVVLGITMDGTKDILGVWIGEHKSSKFWLNVLNDLKSMGVLDVYLFCVDSLKGFAEAIGAVYPQS